MSATPDSTLANPEQRIADLERQLAERQAERDEAQRNLNEATTERDEALARETATAEVVQVINSSPGDLAPVFDVILGKAMQLCDAAFGVMQKYDGECFYPVGLRGVPPAYSEFLLREPLKYAPDTALGRIAAGEDVVSSADAAVDYRQTSPLIRTLQELGGIRSFVFVSLRKDGALIGVLIAYRQEPRPFSDKQIALLQNFAAQAVIAMENARLITETREALEQQTATAEVLQVINSSPGDLTPVFDAILEKALGLCEAKFGNITTYDGEAFHFAAAAGYPEFAEFLSHEAVRPSPVTGWGRIAAGEQFVHIVDLAAEQAYTDREPLRVATVELGGARTCIFVPLVKDNAILGVLTAYRQEVRPFTDKQIALLQSFTAQAVIAMENARLITETREALEQQTATAEVLQVINSSPGDLAPVFDAMLDKAMRLCEAAGGALRAYDGAVFRAVAMRGVPAAFAEATREQVRPDPQTGLGRIEHGERVVQIADLADPEDPRAGTRSRRDMVELGGIRTSLWVALRKEETLLGTFVLYRKEVRPFTEKQIALVENFAAQAVIAMENARLLTETREALEQQTATAEVLQVINSSPGHLAPVFDAMLENATRLCDGVNGILWTIDGKCARLAASRNMPSAIVELLRRQGEAGEHLMVQRVIAGEHLFQFDVAEHDAYRSGEVAAAPHVVAAGVRTIIWVAMVKDGAAVGAFVISRNEVRPFTEKHIALLQNFAAQAVIAMENARLITETREALEQQTATSEVLQVINSSPGDLAPVFDAMLEKAVLLCQADQGLLTSREGDEYEVIAAVSERPEFIAFSKGQRLLVDRGTVTGRVALSGRVVHIPDVNADADYQNVEGARLGNVGTLLGVPLLREGTVVGTFNVARERVERFTDKQIALLQNFAAQAVIAMENARLLTETREALEQQTATAEVLQVINSSPGDLTPVFDAILDKAHNLCGADLGSLFTYDGERFWPVAAQRPPAQFNELMREGFRPGPGNPFARVLEGEPLVHIADIGPLAAQHPDDAGLRVAVEVGLRTFMVVPLRKDNVLLGVITANRREVRPFTDKQIALLQNFAAQAVIAMENARLITETREALEQQTATAEVLGVINSSPGDLAPVFDAMLERALHLCDAAFGMMWSFDGECFETTSLRGVPPGYAEFLNGPQRPSPETAHGRIARGEKLVHIADVAADPLYASGDPHRRKLVDEAGARTFLVAPLHKEERLLGAFSIYRQEVRPFSDQQIALLQNFAAQAVIAMENARLLTETREALEQQTATAEVLQVINSSPGDLAPVFDAILEKAHGLCGIIHGSLQLYDGEKFRPMALRGYPASLADRLQHGWSPGPSHPMRALIDGERFAHFDLAQVDDPIARTVAELGGVRSTLFVALQKDDALLGVITAARDEVRPFSEKQIALLQNFAAQAVIAMENARLLTETREALEQQTATAEILEVINRSPGDLTPVFEAILDKAHTLCGATLGSLFLFDSELSRAVATYGYPGDVAERLRQGVILSATPQLLEGARWVHIPDLRLIDNPTARTVSGRGGVRTNLMLPLRKDGRLLGTISCNRQEVRPFSDKEIALLESFAAQAVIAMDNARLLDEIRQRQAELRVTFDNMGDGVAMFDSELRLAAWNLNFQRILELPDPLLAERPRVGDFVRYLATHGEYGAVDIEAEVRRLSEQVGTQWSAERTRPDGRVIEVRSNPVPGGGVVLIYSDVTERKRAESEIRAARDTAEKALQELQTAQTSLLHAQKMAALGQLTAGIAHEIKNPLNFVNNFAELSGELLLELKETTAPVVAALGDDERAAVDEVVEMLRGNLDKIAEHGKRADGIVKSMLEHSRGVSGERRAVDLNALIEEALNLAYHGARAQDASFNITLEREFDRGLAPTELAPQEMTRVFLNLFGNGFYATAKRQRDGAGSEFRPTLKVATRNLGDAIEVRVRDNGTGIAPEVQDKLFQPFVTTKPTGEGTGLGLSIAYDIVTQQHGGTIEVDSRQGEFTEFTIRLPRRAAGGSA